MGCGMECTSGMQCEPGSLQDHDYFASFSSRETWRCRIGELGGREPHVRDSNSTLVSKIGTRCWL